MLTLAIDQGTHASRALLFDGTGSEVGRASVEIGLRRGDGGVVEQDAREILLATETVIREAMAQAGRDDETVARVGLATQRSTLVLWDRESLQPLMPAVHWQDTRCATELEAMASATERIQAITGLRPTAHYGAPRIAYLLRGDPGLRRLHDAGRLCCAPLASYLLVNLLREKAFTVDRANASRMLLLDLRQGDWSVPLLAATRLRRACLPDCRPVEHAYGRLMIGNAELTAVSGDQNAAIFAQGAPAEATAIANLGSGAFILLPTGGDCVIAPPLLSGLAGGAAGRADYLLEGTVNGAGSALAWAARRLATDIDLSRFDQPGADAVDPPVFLNHVGGLGSPWWRSDAQSAWIDAHGATLVPEPLDGLWAVLESVVFMVCANLRELRQVRRRINRIRVGGGLVSSNRLCQCLADLSGMPVQRFAQTEASARGIAWLAAGRPADWAPGRSRWFEPRINAALLQRYSQFLQSIAA